jgi:hypothetical protein
MTRGTIASVILVIGWTLSSAADEKANGGEEQAKAMAELQQRMLQQFDANKDGVLSEQEKLAAQEALRKQGKVVPGMAPGGFPGAEQFNKQFDRDGDGKLNDAEKAAAMAAYQRLRGGKERGSGGPQLPFGLPFGGERGVAGRAPAEAGAGAAPPAEAKKEKINPLVKRFDKDGDGKLSDEEKAAAQAELKKAKAKGPPKKEKD